jgi:hypothetical protein
MSKPDRKAASRAGERLYLIHYECLRRNAAYRESYAETRGGSDFKRLAVTLDWGIGSGDELPDPSQRPPLDKALRRYIPGGIVSQLVPIIFNRRLDTAQSTVAFAVTDAPGARKQIAGTLVLAHFPDEDPERPAFMALDLRWSKKDLMKRFESWLSLVLAERARAGLKQERPAQRLRLGEYADYLQVYDLRTYEKKTFRQIADALWPGAQGEPEKKARDYYRRGRHLVSNPPLVPRRPFVRPHDGGGQEPR